MKTQIEVLPSGVTRFTAILGSLKPTSAGFFSWLNAFEKSGAECGRLINVDGEQEAITFAGSSVPIQHSLPELWAAVGGSGADLEPSPEKFRL